MLPQVYLFLISVFASIKPLQSRQSRSVAWETTFYRPLEKFHVESTPASFWTQNHTILFKNPCPNPWRKIKNPWRSPTLVLPVLAPSASVRVESVGRRIFALAKNSWKNVRANAVPTIGQKLRSDGVRVRFRVRFQAVKVPIFGGFPVENPTKKATT